MLNNDSNLANPNKPYIFTHPKAKSILYGKY